MLRIRVGVLLMTAILLVLCTLALAYANGANDVSKGVATLVGGGLASPRRGLVWGTVWTMAGGIVALALARGLVTTFSTGLLTAPPSDARLFFLAIAIGAFGWVIVASRTGLPVSTTHALTGAIVGAALATGGPAAVRWPLLAVSVGLPLAASPLASAAIAHLAQKFFSTPLAQASRYCVCVEPRQTELAMESPGVGVSPVLASAMSIGLTVNRAAECGARPIVSGLRLTDAAHWVASAALSFARGMNDNPKIAALAIGALATGGVERTWFFGAGAAAMGLGSYLYGRRVTTTLAEKVTDIDPLEGLTASTVACSLVLLASFMALPVSTTHVSTGAIVGASLRAGTQSVRWRTVASIVTAWVITLPVAGVLAALASTVLSL